MTTSLTFKAILVWTALVFLAFMGEMNNHRDDCAYKPCTSINLVP